ncbi:hypothetical protein CFC21_044036 [Triticum aestivum]|uniref:Late embryogenesis abundant protein LEA-2 subgroup domain-containing protein n=2 Tax=Triticum aestivum TaxID=4565 RepID=A0A9R1JX55_WHEAT|nr:hypothetical protein CFC21_044036 [Triticum aestivum]CDM81921.1 unnamed protein product [Triticum aestivum]
MPTAACDHHSAAAAASRRRLRVCFIISIAVHLLLAVVVAVLAITALRPHPADTTISTIRLTSVSLSPGLFLNVTLDVVLSIRNPSPVASFAHDAGRAEVYYHGALAADANMPPGRIGAGSTNVVTVRLTVLADRLAGYAPQLYGDVLGGAGDVSLTVRTTVPGTVTVLGLLRHHAVVLTVCDVVVSMRRPGTQSSSCQYRTKF